MTHPITYLCLFLVLATFSSMANIELFRPITQQSRYGFLIVASEILALLFITWVTLVALFIAAQKPATAFFMITLAIGMWLDRLLLAIGAWL